VSPIEVEGAITEHKSVLEAAVIPSDNIEGLTVPKAFVVVRQGQKADENLITELKKLVRKIGGYKIPEEIVFVDDLPRTTLMKIDRRTLRELNK
jgi:benzoate-CoA ligase